MDEVKDRTVIALVKVPALDGETCGDTYDVEVTIDRTDDTGFWLWSDPIPVTPDLAMTIAENLIKWAKAQKEKG